MRDESAGETLHFKAGSRQMTLATGSLIKRLLGPLFQLIGRMPGFRLYARWFSLRHLRLERVAVPIPDLPAGLAGLRLGFITDIHYDASRPVALLERGVTLINDARPDVILLGGDYVNSRARDFDRCLAILCRLRAPLGVYGVLGNHDYWAGGDYLAARLAANGVTMLRNTACRLIAPGGAPFWIVGLDDVSRRHDDLGRALAGVAEGEFRLLLVHEPDTANQIAPWDAGIDLQLSGHSHGGQVVLPGIGAPLVPRLARCYISGLYENPRVYTSRGIGTVPPHLRFNCPPEVTLLTLVAPAE